MLAGHAGATTAIASSLLGPGTAVAATGTSPAASRALGTPKQIAAGLLDVGYTRTQE
jgi:hypothetical protein